MQRVFRTAAAATLAALGLIPLASAAAAQPTSYAWVQLGEGGGAEVRAIARDGRCPRLLVDGRAEPMQLRSRADERFPAVCRAALPAGAGAAQLEGATVRLRRTTPRRIVVVGDTGCKVEGGVLQACNNPRAWTFAAIARHAAAQRPDLVIHVGDYYYREDACPAAAASRCAGSPHGDAWPAWEADFFAPAAPLLKAAPWVFVRGNHERCAQGGRGWFRLLDAAPRPLACPGAASAPFTVDVGELRLHVLDSAEASDRLALPGGVAAVNRQLDALTPRFGKDEGWIVVHRPVWGLAPAVRLGPLGPLNVPINPTLQAAFRGRDLAGIGLILSGHIHHFAAYDFRGRRPAQLIVGASGAPRLGADSARLTRDMVMLEGLEAQRLTFARHGYLVLDRVGTGWVGTFRDASDHVVATCRLEARRLNCGRWRTPPG